MIPIYPYCIYVGTNEINKVYQCQPFYAYVFNNASYMVAFGLADNKIDSVETCRKLLFNQLVSDKGLGIKGLSINDLIKDKKWNIGSQFLPNGEKNDCYEILYQLQGKNQLFFIGETVAGFTVPNQIDFIKKFSKQWVETMNAYDHDRARGVNSA